jgi:Recombination endonuclease VII
MKICTKPTCHAGGREQPLENFGVDRQKKDGRRSWCKTCTNITSTAYQQRQRAENAEDYKRRRQATWTKYRYGMTLNELQALLDAAGMKCEICSKPFESRTDAHVDHCHASKKIRGILCLTCNNGLGAFYDKPELLRQAADYLERGDALSA